MAYQRKKRPQDQNQSLTLPQIQASLFASPDREDMEANNSIAEGGAVSAPSLELRRQQASQPSYDFGSIPLFGKRTAQRQPQAPLIQTKLTVGAVGDKYEQEADRVAAQVVDTINRPEANSPVQRVLDQHGGKGAVQRMGEDEEVQMKPMVQRVGGEGGAVTNDLEAEIQRERGKGHSLEPNLQAKMGQAMGTDFSGVKIHTDAQSDRLSQSIQAKAFTTGSDVFFSGGAYNPGTKGGQELIAHELTHVVQQTSMGGQMSQARSQNEAGGESTLNAGPIQRQSVGMDGWVQRAWIRDINIHPESEQEVPELFGVDIEGTKNAPGLVVNGDERTFDLNLDVYPHIKPSAITAYSEGTARYIAQDNVMKDTKAPQATKTYPAAKQNNNDFSPLVAGIYTHSGGKAITVHARNPARALAVGKPVRSIMKRLGYTNEIAQGDPRHASTHMQAPLPVLGGMHDHWFKTPLGASVGSDVESIHEGLIAKGLVNPQPQPKKKKKRKRK